MRPRENRNVHWNAENVWLVESHAEVPLSTQQQEDEDADVHEAHESCARTHTVCCVKLEHVFILTLCSSALTLIGSGFVQVEEDGNQDVQHVTALQHKKQELLKCAVSTGFM